MLIFLGLFVFYFFRDPEREIPSDPGIVVSPADGHVVEIVDEMLDSSMGHRISIFLSIWDVHVQRAPVAGRIADVVYRPGRFYGAFRSAASRENEQNIIYMHTPQGTLVFKQIAGAIARRVLCWKSKGEEVALGERVGMIRFGSRVDIWLPMDAQVVVKRGQKVKGGESVLAKWNSTTIDPIGHEEEPRRLFRSHRLRRGVYILPSAFTVANLLCGYYAILATLEGQTADFDNAACADRHRDHFRFAGRPRRARHGHQQRIRQAVRFARGHRQFRHRSRVSRLRLGSARDGGGQGAPEALHLTQLGWLIGFFYVGCCAWRLARFNIQGMAPGRQSLFRRNADCPPQPA